MENTTYNNPKMCVLWFATAANEMREPCEKFWKN